MRDLCLGIALCAAVVGGLESVATLAVHWTTELTEAQDLEDMLDLDLDRPDLELDLDFGAAEDGEAPSGLPTPADPRGR